MPPTAFEPYVAARLARPKPKSYALCRPELTTLRPNWQRSKHPLVQFREGCHAKRSTRFRRTCADHRAYNLLLPRQGTRVDRGVATDGQHGSGSDGQSTE